MTVKIASAEMDDDEITEEEGTTYTYNSDGDVIYYITSDGDTYTLDELTGIECYYYADDDTTECYDLNGSLLEAILEEEDGAAYVDGETVYYLDNHNNTWWEDSDGNTY